MKNQSKKVETIYEDDFVIVMNKPSGLLSIPDRYDPTLPNLYGLLQKKLGQVFIVHRIDKDTSGVICFAKDEEMHKELNKQFEDRAVEKNYWALVNGRPDVEGEITASIAPHHSQKGKMKAFDAPKYRDGRNDGNDRNAGKASLTQYKVLEQFNDWALCEVQILTGRTHQIRVHFAHIGHSLAIDPLYGSGKGMYLSAFKKKYKLGKWAEERPLMDRLSLHAKQLSFYHSRLEKKIYVEAELPKDFRVLLKQLKKYGKEFVV